MFFGKIIGGLLGFLAGGIPGFILGTLAGHYFDKALAKAMQFSSPEGLSRVRKSFFETTFLLSGYLAKADGRVSKSEIAHAEQLFTQMALSAEQRQRAIDLFRQGSQSDFQVEPAVASFLQACGPHKKLQQTLLLFLISQAYADQDLAAAEHTALLNVAKLMGLAANQLERLLRMAQAQDHFHHQGGYGATPGTSLDDAYAALGVDSSIGDKELKRAYRKLMSEHHPDKLIAKGVPEDMLKLATERAQEIQAAYEMVKETRPAIR
jgi:DnaJ like chaperone protein